MRVCNGTHGCRVAPTWKFHLHSNEDNARMYSVPWCQCFNKVGVYNSHQETLSVHILYSGLLRLHNMSSSELLSPREAWIYWRNESSGLQKAWRDWSTWYMKKAWEKLRLPNVKRRRLGVYLTNVLEGIAWRQSQDPLVSSERTWGNRLSLKYRKFKLNIRCCFHRNICEKITEVRVVEHWHRLPQEAADMLQTNLDIALGSLI